MRLEASSGSLDLLILGELAPQYHPQTHRLPGGGGGQQLPEQLDGRRRDGEVQVRL